MAKKTKKSLDVQKFGGVEELGSLHINGYQHEASSIEAQSETRLEQDTGEGGAAIIRRFTFGVNPEAFAQHTPTMQELFNYHHKGIEIALWRDGMAIITEVQPRVIFDKQNTKYHIFVGARPLRGHVLRETPQTLSQIVHGN